MRTLVRLLAPTLLFVPAACSRDPGGSYPLVCAQGQRMSDNVFSVDAGEFDEMNINSYECEIKNVSRAPLVLREDVQTSCTCVGASLSDTTVAPGASVKVTLRMSTKDGAGSQSSIQAQILSETNSHPPLVLQVHYRVKPGWTCTPARVVLEPGEDGWARAQVHVVARGRPQLAVTSVECPAPQIESVLSAAPGSKAETSGTVAIVDLKCRVPIGEGTREYPITIRTDDPYIPTRQVQAVVASPPALRIEPDILHLTGAEGQSVGAAIKPTSARVHLLSASSDSPLIDVALNLGEAGTGRLTVKWKGQLRPQREVATVKIRYRVEDRGEPLEVSVPVAIQPPA